MSDQPDGALVDRVRRDLVGLDQEPTVGDVVNALADLGLPVAGPTLLARAERIWAEIAGLGPLQPFAVDGDVTDILVVGETAWVDRGQGLQLTDVRLTEQAARALAVRLAAAGGRRLDDAMPIVDARLPDGIRLHAVLPPISSDGVLINLRIPHFAALTMADLVANGTVPPHIRPILMALIARRANLLISGATGSGKTTLLAALLGLVEPDERIVCIEEATELAPDHPHVVHLQARRPNVEGVGAVNLAELVVAALRMRPDRIVVGECRGGEVREMLTALNTGHSGGAATVHANSAADVLARLEALGALAEMSHAAVRHHAAAAINAIVHLAGTTDGRRLVEIATIRRRGDDVGVETVVTVGSEGKVTPGPGWAEFNQMWLT
jgi:pilus assembly protein CpaF